MVNLADYLVKNRVDNVNKIVELLNIDYDSLEDFSSMGKFVEESIIASEEFIKLANTPLLSYSLAGRNIANEGGSPSLGECLEGVIKNIGTQGVRFVLLRVLLRSVCDIKVSFDNKVLFSSEYVINHSLLTSKIYEHIFKREFKENPTIETLEAILFKEIGVFSALSSRIGRDSYSFIPESEKKELRKFLEEPPISFRELGVLYCKRIGLPNIGEIIDDVWVKKSENEKYKALRDAEALANYKFPLCWLNSTPKEKLMSLKGKYQLDETILDINYK